MSEVARRFTRVASTYDTVVPFFSRFADELVRVAAPSGPTLDIACGTGAVLARLPAGSVGVDLTEAMVRRTDGVACVGDVSALPVRDRAFDLVTCGFGVFFFPSIADALDEVRRVGRRFAATTFGNGHGGFAWQLDFMREQGFGGTAASRSPVVTADGLRAALVDAGFVEVRTERVAATYDFDLPTYERWYRSTAAPDVLERFAGDAVFVDAWRECAASHDLTLHQEVDVTTAVAP